jgi:heme O synthase-like polyprenyltransferase
MRITSFPGAVAPRGGWAAASGRCATEVALVTVQSYRAQTPVRWRRA